MTYDEVLTAAREKLAPRCRVCKECDGRVCAGETPGVGGKGSGRAFMICREFFKSINIHLDVIYEPGEIDMSAEFFGRRFSLPVCVAPIGGMDINYTNAVSEEEYSEYIVGGARAADILPFTGDGASDRYFEATLAPIKAAGGIAVPTLKPWAHERNLRQVRALEELGVLAFASDIDSAGLINLKLLGKPVSPKPVSELRELVEETKLPFVVKGVMTAGGAMKALEAGAYGIVVSSHGGRVLEDAPCPASMLPEIRAAVGDKLTLFVDGGIRSGADVFKALALGADGVLIGRPYAIAAHGGGAEGVELYTKKLAAELQDVMLMTGCKKLSDITIDKIRL